MSATFAELDLRPELVQALTGLGYEEPTPIQAAAIPALLTGQDLLGQAATGTGKTAAFALPVLQRLGEERTDAPNALILTPTRELAMQVSEAVHKYGRGMGARVVPVFGGQPIGRQIKALQRGVDVVVATPGRALDLLKRGALDLSSVGTVVLDEADEMLDMGFAEDLEALLGDLPDARQTVLLSATMPDRIAALASRHLRDPQRIELGGAGVGGPQADGPAIEEVAYVVARPHKPAALGRVLDVQSPGAALVFCRTRSEVDALTETLNGRGYRAEALHGGLGQDARTKVVNRLRNGTTELLIATDVAARGLDVDVLTHVVNYDVPSSPETYVHRIGRVGRAGREGVAITLAQPREHPVLRAFEATTGRRIAVEPLPTVADLRVRRAELVRDALRDAIAEEELDALRPLVETLCEDHDLMDVALAAVKLASDAVAPEADDREVPAASFGKAPRQSSPGGGKGGGKNGGRSFGDGRGGGGGGGREGRGGRDARDGEPSARLFIGAGKQAGVRPQDLVGAITGESDLTGHDIGAIAVHDRHSLVEIPAAQVDRVVAALRGTKIKGNRPTIRRDRF